MEDDAQLRLRLERETIEMIEFISENRTLARAG